MGPGTGNRLGHPWGRPWVVDAGLVISSLVRCKTHPGEALERMGGPALSLLARASVTLGSPSGCCPDDIHPTSALLPCSHHSAFRPSVAPEIRAKTPTAHLEPRCCVCVFGGWGVGRWQPRFQPGAGSSRDGCGPQKEGVGQRWPLGTAWDCGTLGFREQVLLDTEETIAGEKAGGEGEAISRSPSPQGSLREQGPLGERRQAI